MKVNGDLETDEHHIYYILHIFNSVLVYSMDFVFQWITTIRFECPWAVFHREYVIPTERVFIFFAPISDTSDDIQFRGQNASSLLLKWP